MAVSKDTSNRIFPGAFWGELKEKYKKLAEEKDETDCAFEFLLGMFEWEDLPETVDQVFLDAYLLGNGLASVRKDHKGEYRAMLADPAGAPDPYGIGELLLSRTENGEVFTDKKDSDDVAYGWNNRTKTPCMDAYRLGAYIAELDTSLDLLVWWSRASRLFIASDNKTKRMLEEAFQNMKKGVPLTIQSEQLLKEIETGKLSVQPEDLTDTNFSDKLDKLAFIREKRFDWFKDRYGMCARDTAKKAQVSVDEANGDTGAAMIFPLNMLHEREKFAEMMNQKFGWHVSVHFSGAWLGEMARYETTIVENENIDIDGYDPEKETPGEPAGEPNAEPAGEPAAEPNAEREEKEGAKNAD